MESWSFGIDNDKLIDLVLKGLKTATTCPYDEDDIPVIGKRTIIKFDNEKDACVVETKKFIVTEFKNITSELAYLEGEDDRTLSSWRKVHMDYFTSFDKSFNENSLVIFEIFEMVENLVEKRLLIGKQIVENNKNLIGNIVNIKEINSGFNNTLFNVNDKYVIKVCTNRELESEFKVEYNFYINNKDNKNIPVLYKYDNSKKEVPFIYEIMEKIDGNTLYYYWYKMNELERENTIKNLIEIIKKFHKKINSNYDWSKSIKEEIFFKINECKELFDTIDYNMIIESLEKYDEYLSNNYFALIHNDLHFDNIIYNNGFIKIIDFNDSMEAPIDYEFRQLYMCITKPWKWADIQMDPLQKPEDYKNIFDYIKKYYKDLNDIRHLEERMIIYSILNDVRHLKKYKSKELINSIVENTKKLYR